MYNLPVADQLVWDISHTTMLQELSLLPFVWFS